VAEQIRGDADLLGGAVDELRHGAVTEQVGPDVPVEGLLGAGFDLLPDRGATHRPAVAVEPEVIPLTDLGVAACKRLQSGAVVPQLTIEVWGQLRRHRGDIRPAGGLGRAQIRPYAWPSNTRCCPITRSARFLIRIGQAIRSDDRAIAVVDSHIHRPICLLLAAIHEAQPQLEQVRGADDAGQLVARGRRGLPGVVVHARQRPQSRPGSSTESMRTRVPTIIAALTGATRARSPATNSLPRATFAPSPTGTRRVERAVPIRKTPASGQSPARPCATRAGSSGWRPCRLTETFGRPCGTNKSQPDRQRPGRSAGGRLFVHVLLVEGEELSSNLCALFSMSYKIHTFLWICLENLGPMWRSPKR
jgi:hypothetical protein